MAESTLLNINFCRAALGRAQPFIPGERFELQGKNWDEDVQRLMGAYPLKDGAAMRFAAQDSARPGRPALVLGPDGIRIVGTVLREHAVLAEACGVDWR